MNTIYRLNSGKIEVYNYEPLMSRVALFRLQEMKKIPEDERVILEEPNGGWFTRKKDMVYECGSYILKKKVPKKFEEKEDNYRFVKRYIHGIFRHPTVEVRDRIDKPGEIIVLTPDRYHETRKVQITKDAYLEYLLDNEEFLSETLQEGDLSSIKDLFKMPEDPNMEISVDEMKKVFESGLARGNVDSKMEYLEGSTKVFEKLHK